MSVPKVAIVIVNWNGLTHTVECLESIFKLEYQNYEVIVVDNGSKDESAEVIRKKWPQIAVIKNKENMGYTGGNNQGIEYALKRRAEYVWLLNNDTIVEEDTLAKLVAAGKNDARIGLISPVIYNYNDRSAIQFCGSYINWEKLALENAEDYASWERIDSELYTMCLWGTALLINCNVLQQIGSLDSKYFAYFEDFDYCLRASRAGYRCALEPGAKVYHKDSQCTGNRNAPLQVFLRTRNIYFFWMDNLRGKKRVSYLLRFIADVISNGGELKTKKLDDSVRACFEGAWAALRGKGGAWDGSKKTPYVVGKILDFFCSWHPNLWESLFKLKFIWLGRLIVQRGRKRLLKLDSF